MALVCHNCEKRAQRGNRVSHAKIRTHRKFMANLHVHWISVKGKKVRAKFCSNCLRALRKSEKPIIPIQTSSVGQV